MNPPFGHHLSFPVWPRRSFLQAAGLALSAPAWAFAARDDRPPANSTAGVAGRAANEPRIPPQPADLVREMVRVSHFDLKRVQQLVEAQPSLARAAWDWGFGDWETALGAASHMGNRPIAEYLIAT